MALLSDLYKKVKPVAATVGNFLGDATGLNQLSHGISDSIASRLYQPQIDAQNARAAASNQAILQRAQQLKVKNPQQAQKLVNIVKNAPAPQSFEKDILGRGITSNADVLQGAGNLAGLATMGLSTPAAISSKIGSLTSPTAKLAAWGTVRGAENALPGVVTNAFQGKPVKEIGRQAGTDFVTGAALNTILSPRLVFGSKTTGHGAIRSTLGKIANTANSIDEVPLRANARALFSSEIPQTSERIVNGAKVTEPFNGRTVPMPLKEATEAIRTGYVDPNSVPAYAMGARDKGVVNITHDAAGKVVAASTDVPAFEARLTGVRPASANPQIDPYQMQDAFEDPALQFRVRNPEVQDTGSVQNALQGTQPTLEASMASTAQKMEKDIPFIETDPNAKAKAVLSLENKGRGVHALPDQVKADFQDWVNSTKPDTLALEAQKVRQTFKPLDDLAARTEGPNTPPGSQLFRFQGNTPSSPEEAQGFQALRQYFETKFSQLAEAGVLDPNQHQSDYLTQIWKDSPEQIQEKVDRALQLNPSLSKEKVIADYQEGIAAGLTPKYSDLSDIAAEYEKAANRALADTNYLKQGMASGHFQPTGGPGFTQLTHFPNASVQYEKGGQTVSHSGPIYAPTSLAEPINNRMGQARILNNWTKVATELKNIVLSGGIPGTSWNFHGFTTLGRDTLTAGNPLKMVRNLATDIAAMTYDPMNKAYVAKNIDQVTELLHAGLTLSTEAPSFSDTKAASGLGKAAYESAKGLFENPLFEGFIPAVKSRFAIEAVDNMVGRGVPREEALSAAAHQANTIFGGNNMAELGANKDAENVLRSIFLAPDTYRSLGKTAAGVVKAITSPKDPNYWAFRSVAMNAAAAYTLMNLANKKATGHWMYENAPGHTFEVQAGYDTDGNPRYVRPLGQSLDFVKIPVDAVSSVKNGDYSQVARVVQNRLTPLISQAVQIATNTNPQGGSITKASDTPAQKQMKYLANATNSFLPQGLTAGAQYLAGEKNGEQALATAIELPIRYGHAASSDQEQALQEILKQQGQTGNEIGRQLETFRNGNTASTAQLNALKRGDTAPSGRTASATGSVPSNVTSLQNGKYAVRKSNGSVETYADQASAAVAAAKDQAASTGKPVTYAGTTYYKKNDGNVGTYRLDDLKAQAAANKLDLDIQTARNSNDYSAWNRLQNQKLQALQDKISSADPVLDQAKVLDWQKQAASLAKTVATTKSYGNSFNKPKAVKKPKVVKLAATAARMKATSYKVKAPPKPKAIKGPKAVKKVTKPKLTSR